MDDDESVWNTVSIMAVKFVMDTTDERKKEFDAFLDDELKKLRGDPLKIITSS